MRRALASLLPLMLAGACSGLEARDTGGEHGSDAGATGGDAAMDPAEGAGLPASEDTPAYSEGDSLDPGTGAGRDDDVCFLADAEPAPYECDATLLRRCPGLRSCCVGDGDCCSAVAGGALPDAISLGECDDGDAASCLAEDLTVSAFGDPQPRIQGGALLPNGDDSYDSGLVLGEPIDLTAHRVKLDARFAKPTDCGASCLEGVGVGFSAQATFGDTTHVRLMVGLLYSGSRNDVSLVIGDEIARSWDLADAGEETWSLVVRPTGVLDVMREGSGVPVHSADLAPTDGARLVVYGRNHNRPADSPLGARITSLAVSTELCDMPSAWPERSQLTFREPGSAAWGPSFLHAPTAALDGAGELTVALEHDGKIIVARPQDGGSPTELDLTGSPDTSVIPVPTGARLADPELHWNAATSGWVLYFTVDEGALASIGRAVHDGTSWATETVIEAGASPWIRIEQPSVHLHHSGTWVMATRVTDPDGGQQLALYTSRDGKTWTPWDDGDLGPITRRGDVSASGFDADEIAHPSLIVHDGAWQLHYAGRRGTRWGVGLLLSDELLRWRWFAGGQPIFEGDGNGFDRVGVGAPDAVSVGATVELYYEGTDGTRSRLGRAVRQAAELGTR